MTNSNGNSWDDIREILREVAYAQSQNAVAITANTNGLAQLRSEVAALTQAVAELRVISDRHQASIERLERQG
ncbi:MAG: hypothetical protein JOZ78_25920 [Chroococcidiopsidaceae cyanobacterium CP_BM_ER_R8_30]|nr:hypothetical protein [Chroococcidiopsidaceae cyanobacterium CP_BM_ER_R8_30]